MQGDDEQAHVSRTGERLRRAAWTAFGEQGWAGLDVARVCRRAGLARSTFYAHYEVVEHALAEELLTRYRAEQLHGPEHVELDPTTLLRGGRPLSYPFWVHLDEHRRVYRQLVASPRGAVVLDAVAEVVAVESRRLHAPLRETASQPVDADLVAGTLAGALLGAARWWLREEPEAAPSPQQMSYRFSAMVAPGVLGVMGL